MLLWTRDTSYLKDPVFLHFYARTVKDYVDRWDLSLEKIPTRKRFMNRERYDPEDAYQYCRGIPSYHERASPERPKSVWICWLFRRRPTGRIHGFLPCGGITSNPVFISKKKKR